MKNYTILFLLFVSAFSFAQSPITRNGLKFERITRIVSPAVLDSAGRVLTPETKSIVETGLQVGIEVDIDPNPLIALAHTRKAELMQFQGANTLALIVMIRINYYNLEGVRMLDAIQQDDSLSVEAKRFRSMLFASYDIQPKSTDGSYMMADGSMKIVPAGTPGSLPENAIYQNMTVEQAKAIGLVGPSENRPLQMFYAMLKFGIKSIIAREGL